MTASCGGSWLVFGCDFVFWLMDLLVLGDRLWCLVLLGLVGCVAFDCVL